MNFSFFLFQSLHGCQRTYTGAKKDWHPHSSLGSILAQLKNTEKPSLAKNQVFCTYKLIIRPGEAKKGEVTGASWEVGAKVHLGENGKKCIEYLPFF